MAGEFVDGGAPVAETLATRVWAHPASSNIENPKLQIICFNSVVWLQSNPSACLRNCAGEGAKAWSSIGFDGAPGPPGGG